MSIGRVAIWALTGAVLFGPAAALAQEATQGAESGAPQPAPGKARPGFGTRDSVGVSVERAFGFTSLETGENDHTQTTASIGLQPVYWAALGVFDLYKSGLNWGALFGGAHLTFNGGGSNSETFHLTVLQLRPRIGYASSQNQTFGFWVRGGPAMWLVIPEDRTTDAQGNTSTEHPTTFMLGVGGEAYAVVTPAPHLAILAGPHAEFNVYGTSSERGTSDPTASTLGFTMGLMGEFY